MTATALPVMTDHELIAALSARDPAAVSVFYQRYRNRILAVAMRHVSDLWDAEEVLQDVVWIVFRKAEGFRGEAEFSSWLYRVTQNCSRMLLRKRRRLPTPMLMEDMEPAMQLARGGELQNRLEESAQHRMAAVKINKHIDGLDPINREIFVSAAVEGDTAEEVSKRLGLSTLAVKARLHRIRQTMRNSMESLELVAA
jgi:RNA polymerase sigma-70 factor (ECF subfamily)